MEILIENNKGNENNSGELKTKRLSPFGYAIKLFAKWFGFTSLYTAFSVCPFCGQQGCPVGIGSASIIGAFFALVFNDWKILYLYINKKLKTQK